MHGMQLAGSEVKNAVLVDEEEEVGLWKQHSGR